MLVVLADLWLHNTTVNAALREGVDLDHGRLYHATRLLLVGLAYGTLALLFVRVAMPGPLREMLAIAPPRLAGPMATLLRLRLNAQPRPHSLGNATASASGTSQE